MKLSPVPRPPPPSEIFKHVRVWRAPVYWAAARGAIERERERERGVLNSLRLFPPGLPNAHYTLHTHGPLPSECPLE